MPLLELRAISKDFPGVRALDGVSFDLEPGEIHALCGENGAGKSTLIKILCGVHPAGSYGGEVRLRGETVCFRGLPGSAAQGIALIAQELALVPGLSVAENLLLGREPRRYGLVRWAEVRDAARRALDRVGLAVPVETPVRELGVGQQQLVEIARALMKDATILVLDEPTAALPEADAQCLLGLLGELRRKGVAAIYVSHRLDEVFAVADRITVLRDGRSVGTARRAETSPERVVAAMVGREINLQVNKIFPRSEGRPGEVLLRVRDWAVADPQNPGRRVVDGVSFDLRAGEVLGVGGLMGAGRTALLASLFGAARSPVQGTIQIAGDPPRAPFRQPREAIAAGLALVGEDRKRYGLFPRASVLDNLTLAALPAFRRRGLLGLRGLLDDGGRRAAASGQAAALRLKAASLEALAEQLSGGNQQKVILGRWLLRRPRVLLLDEPTRGIDVGARSEIYELIGRLVAGGMGIVLVSSELPELLGLAHRVLVLSQGRPAGAFAGEAATPERVMAAATSLIADVAGA
jgi:D-xylose transport system ATP-binding protein